MSRRSRAAKTPDADITTGKRRTLRRSLVITFTSVSLLSVLLLGALNYYQARELLTDSVSDQLVNQQAAKALAIRNGVDRLEQTVALTARSSSVVDALIAFTDAYGLLDQPDLLAADQTQRLNDFYGSVQQAIADAGFESLVSGDLLPRTNAGRYLQYHYIVDNPNENRSDLVVAGGDESQYAAVHTERHPDLLELRSQLGFGDLLLVDTAGNVVYSTGKRLDFATNASSGPYRATGMGRAVTSRIAAAPVGDAVFVDFELYLPASGKPSLFVAAAVRDEARTIGAVLAEIPVDALNNLTVGDGDWEENGFGTTGEVYVVGRDSLMRTDSRLWLEDPDAYLRALENKRSDPRVGELVQTFGSTILIQPVETEAVLVALEGEQFLGRTRDYLGRSSLAAAGPVGSDKVDWVVVAAISSPEANEPLQSYLNRILIAGAVLVPIVILLALFFADRMTRPARPVVEAAGAVVGGDLDVEVPDLGRNEFGDVGRRLNRLTAALREKEAALTAEEEEIRQLLLSALPPRLVDALQISNRTVLDLVDTAAVVAFDVDGMLEVAGIDGETVVELSTEFSAAVESIADRIGVERVRSSTDQHVFAAGLGIAEHATDAAAEFIFEVAAMIVEFGKEHGVDLTYRAGISSGGVISGLVRSDQLTYGVFGDPPRAALALVGVAGPNQVLVDEAAGAELRSDWTLISDPNLIDLRGEQVTAQVLAGRRDQST